MAVRPLALFRSAHPGPSVVVTLVAVGLTFAMGDGALHVALASLATFAGQLSIGLSNDAVDAARDRAAERRDKPITLGEVSERSVLAASIVSSVAALGLALPLGWAALLALVVVVAPGWAYNLGLKATPLSMACYLVSFAAIPVFAALARPVPAWPAWWVIVVAALLGAAGHFANTLPDLEDDARAGIRGLPQILGRTPSVIGTYACLLAAAVIESFGAGGAAFLAGDAGLGILLVLSVIGLLLSRRPTRWHFRLILLAAVVEVAVLLTAAPSLLA